MVEGAVGLAVAAAVESVSVGFAAGGWDGADAAQGGEFGVGGDAVGVVAGGDEELSGTDRADSVAAA